MLYQSAETQIGDYPCRDDYSDDNDHVDDSAHVGDDDLLMTVIIIESEEKDI